MIPLFPPCELCMKFLLTLKLFQDYKKHRFAHDINEVTKHFDN